MQQYSGLLQINLTAIRHNWRQLRASFTGRDCGAVVKANAYGLGYAPVVQALFSEGCKSFFVANFDEAIAVKKLLAERATIYVLQGCPAGMERQFQRANIVPVLISEVMLRRWCRLAAPAAMCAIKVNTGMNRLGLSPAELESCLSDERLWRHTTPVALLSHMACADEEYHPLNRLQLDRFQSVVKFAQQRFPDIHVSLANSAAVFLGADWHFDMARPGIALYGGGEGIPLSANLRPVVTLMLPIMQIRTIQEGEWVGYGADFCAPKEMRIAVAGGGYADGVIRAFSNQVSGFFKNFKLPLLGRVSMDSCVFDVSSLPQNSSLVEGAYIEILGAHCDITEQAGMAGTISYELLTRLGERLEKRYVEW